MQVSHNRTADFYPRPLPIQAQLTFVNPFFTGHGNAPAAAAPTSLLLKMSTVVSNVPNSLQMAAEAPDYKLAVRLDFKLHNAPQRIAPPVKPVLK